MSDNGAGERGYLAGESLRLEYVTTSVGFDDVLDITLGLNHPQFDTCIVVTSQEDKKTQAVAAKHGAICAITDLFKKNGRKFNKGAAINEGFSRFQYHGWRCHMDADMVVPDSFRRLLFNHTHLNLDCIYGADRIDVKGVEALNRAMSQVQHLYSYLLIPNNKNPVGARYIDTLRGYVPIGYFQMWHASYQKWYPYSLGTASHDDVMFGAQWPRDKRIVLPGAFLWHLTDGGPMGQNWEGRRSKRIKK